MSDRRSRVAPLVGAGAAGLALAFVAAPHAVAHQAPQASSSPSGPARSGADPAAPQPQAETTTTTTTPPPSQCGTVQPNYGSQKFRVGVQIKSGAYVPDGTTTAGSQVTITESGPCVDNDSHTITTTCTTVAASSETPGAVTGKIDAPTNPVINDTVTYCKFPGNIPDLRKARAGARADAPLYFDDFYYAEPDSTVTLTQKTVEPNLIIDAVSQTVSPGGNAYNPDCQSTIFCATTRAAVVFNDTAPGPDAVDDCTINVSVGKSALIDVEANDKPKAPITALAVADPPSAGKAAVEGSKIRYTPDGTNDTDSFRYRITTANGSSEARVCLAIAGVAASTTNRPSSTPPTTIASSPATSVPPTTGSVSPTTITTTAPPLANTGTPSSSLGAIGVGLIVVGGAATAAGVRRRRGRHA